MTTTVILGAGNELMKDEGVGVHAIRTLHDELCDSRPDIKLIDAGTSPDFGHLIEGADKLVIVDAVEGGCEPGTIYRFTPQQIESESGLTTSFHQIGLLENLRMMELLGMKVAETVIIGVEPADVQLGLSLSPEIELQMPKIIQSVLDEIHH
jgi:hydrogenase maturation protease